MAQYHITCRTLSSTVCAASGYNHVTHVGYSNNAGGVSVVTRQQMVELLEAGNTAYTTGGGETAEVQVVTCDRCHSKFLKTVPDDTKANNLRNLPSC